MVSDRKASRILELTPLSAQEGRYSYLAVDDADGITIKLIVGEHLACEVNWTG